jgi:hypothetical protein
MESQFARKGRIDFIIGETVIFPIQFVPIREIISEANITS